MTDQEKYSIRQHLENKMGISSLLAVKIVEACNYNKEIIYDICEGKYYIDKHKEGGMVRYGPNGYLLVLRTKQDFNFDEMKRHAQNRIKNLKKQNSELEKTYEELLHHYRSVKSRINGNLKEIGKIKKQFDLEIS